MDKIKKAVKFVNANSLITLGTATKEGLPYCASIYAVADEDFAVYFVTKEETRKYKNIVDNPSVSMVSINEKNCSTLQLTGLAKDENNPKKRMWVVEKIAATCALHEEWRPPVEQLDSGNYCVVKVTPSWARLADFSKPDGKPELIEIVSNLNTK